MKFRLNISLNTNLNNKFGGKKLEYGQGINALTRCGLTLFETYAQTLLFMAEFQLKYAGVCKKILYSNTPGLYSQY